MKKLIELEDLPLALEKIHKLEKSIILTGGVFDILHRGHIAFLNKAKKLGGLLLVFLESDENVKNKKGKNRPFNTQKKRALILTTIDSIDFIILLKGVTKDEDYDKLIVLIKPSVIALTQGDPNTSRRKKQAETIGARLISVERKNSPTTTDLTKNI